MNIVVLISGDGSNLQAIINHFKNSPIINISAVISNNPDAYGLTRAKKANIPQYVINHQLFDSRNQFDSALQQCIDQFHPDLVVLAGFMRKLTPEFVRHYSNRMINIHPSLLPKYKGLNTHERALAAGDKKHGVSIHYVTEALDEGPIIAQSEIDILEEDTIESLKKRIQQVEHKLYPQIIEKLAQK